MDLCKHAIAAVVRLRGITHDDTRRQEKVWMDIQVKEAKGSIQVQSAGRGDVEGREARHVNGKGERRTANENDADNK